MSSSALTLQTYSKDFGEHQAQLTTLVVDGEPWFKGSEAAAALGYAAPAKAVRTHVDKEDRQRLDNLRGTISVPLTNPNEGACTYISESGLYSLIMSSKLPCAKAFKRWVLKEVIPSIRRTGSYSAQASLEEEEEKTTPRQVQSPHRRRTRSNGRGVGLGWTPCPRPTPWLKPLGCS